MRRIELAPAKQLGSTLIIYNFVATATTHCKVMKMIIDSESVLHALAWILYAEDNKSTKPWTSHHRFSHHFATEASAWSLVGQLLSSKSTQANVMTNKQGSHLFVILPYRQP